jgi:hypothetical protein
LGKLIQEPTAPRCTGSFNVRWSFETGGEDQWNLWQIRGDPDDIFKNRPPLTAETQVRRLKLDVNYHAGLGGERDEDRVYLTDLRCALREKLKKAFPEVTINLTD